MGKIILENVTPDEISQKLQDAGVRPGERLTVEVRREGDIDAFTDVVESIRASAEASGLTEEEFARIVNMKPDEFETLFGRPMRHAAE